ncbi:MAG: beta-galactosidase [Planctomycetota bacterium]|jgi:beta-galactosidase
MPTHVPVSPRLPKLFHGGDYNPDQWPEDIRIEDVRLMKLSGMNLMSTGIFSWAQLEPEEGKYDWAWLDETFDRLHDAGVFVALATPSSSPPHWMADKCPEIMAVYKDTHRGRPGVRQVFCPTSPIYRREVLRMNQLLADRYGQHPGLALWHVSNEYGHLWETCYCELCQEAFRQWLQKRYGDIDTVNDQWWTRFWSHTFNDFSQINPPTDHGHVNGLTGLMLDWRRFCSTQIVEFFKAECEPLRAVTPNVPITTNFMGLFNGMDYAKFADAVDVVSWDSYPEVGCDPAFTAMTHSLMRGVKNGDPWLLMEQTPSSTNWHRTHQLKPPGLMRNISFQAIGHGSDAAMYFQWRRCRGGHEKFHGAVVAHVAHENTRVFQEVAQLGSDMDALSEAIVGTRAAKARVGMLWSSENRWALDLSAGPGKDKKFIETNLQHYRSVWRQKVPIDVVRMDGDWSHYDILIAPMCYMVKSGTFPLEGTAEELHARIDEGAKISDWVANGGTFVTTHLSGMTNESDLVYEGGYPGPLRKLLGIWSEEIDNHPEGEAANDICMTGELKLPKAAYACDHYFDQIHAEGADVLATYGKNWYAGRPCVTRNSVGKGQAYYVATCADEDFLTDLYAALMVEKGIQPLADSTDDVEVLCREADDRTLLFILNHSGSDRQADLGSQTGTDLLTGDACSGTIELSAYDVRVIKLN